MNDARHTTPLGRIHKNITIFYKHITPLGLSKTHFFSRCQRHQMFITKKYKYTLLMPTASNVYNIEIQIHITDANGIKCL